MFSDSYPIFYTLVLWGSFAVFLFVFRKHDVPSPSLNSVGIQLCVLLGLFLLFVGGLWLGNTCGSHLDVQPMVVIWIPLTMLFGIVFRDGLSSIGFQLGNTKVYAYWGVVVVALVVLRVFDSKTSFLGPSGTFSWVNVGLVVLAGVSEELVFRGLLQNRLEDFLGPTKAVLISSVVFGLFHQMGCVGLQLRVIFDGVLLFKAFVLGAVFGTIFLRCRSIVPSSVVHVVWNLVILY